MKEERFHSYRASLDNLFDDIMNLFIKFKRELEETSHKAEVKSKERKQKR